MQLCLQSYASHEFQLYAVNQSNAPCVEDSYEAGCWSPDEHNAKLLDAVASLFVQPGSLIDVLCTTTSSRSTWVLAVLCPPIKASRRGFTRALIEKHHAGGYCLNVGCVPSKTEARLLLRRARPRLRRRGVVAGAWE